MGRKPRIDQGELARLAAEGWSNARLAEHFGVSESGILQAKRAAGLSKPMTDHSRALPWRLRREHSQSGPATNLRNLSAVAQGRPAPKDKVATAVRWASRLVDGGLDIAYDQERGFHEVPARGASHIARVLAEARAVLDDASETAAHPADDTTGGTQNASDDAGGGAAPATTTADESTGAPRSNTTADDVTGSPPRPTTQM
ncbi:hypothetical protein [Microbispora sp. ATCC PTA-5024]|uniref:hypothetical protein n=1 Tax=Microbispora sp. ATCC PTA-5024 TaxID=316330 RepID=UPI0003DD7152|nr:hypothetical protein [Microbispora sp. ATCC PTA-5024]ETK36610.1 hypothetical protein MPTA5024_08020 [Microbispora sp. ATCC PTA-5024]